MSTWSRNCSIHWNDKLCRASFWTSHAGGSSASVPSCYGRKSTSPHTYSTHWTPCTCTFQSWISACNSASIFELTAATTVEDLLQPYEEEYWSKWAKERTGCAVSGFETVRVFLGLLDGVWWSVSCALGGVDVFGLRWWCGGICGIFLGSVGTFVANSKDQPRNLYSISRDWYDNCWRW